MCGRFTLQHSPEQIAMQFDLDTVVDFPPQYNIAPTQMVLAVLVNHQVRQSAFLRWGLIPSWAKDTNIGANLINARSETVAEKPSFRNAFKRRRCLIVADGFYEWKRQGKSKLKQPVYFHLNHQAVFGFAGLWEHWRSPTGEEINSCTILTTTANELLQPIHDRMPVILAPEDYQVWLNPEVDNTQQLQDLLKPYPSEAMQAYQVSTLVNNARHEGAECIEKLIS